MIERIHRYVAIGDSFTEGLGDGAVADLPRGWADRLAGVISARRRQLGLAPLEYANLAIRGKLLNAILTEQLPAALEHEPDLISIVGGGNDLLRPGADPDALAKRLEFAVLEARRGGAHVLLGTGMDPRDLPLVRRIREKVAIYNSHIWSIARNQGAAVVDLWGLRALGHPDMWAKDKIHLSSLGHHRVAQGALVALGLTPEDPKWRTLLPPPQLTRWEAVRHQTQWVTDEVGPWITRRVLGRSSGDGRVAKYPALIVFDEVDRVPQA